MKKVTLFSLVFLVFFACRKDIDEQTTNETHFNPPVIDLSDFNPEVISVTASLAGVVYDEAGQPIVGASVTLNNLNRTTDDRGSFVFRQVNMNAAGTFVLVQKDGYFNGSTRFFPKEGSQNYTNIIMLSKSSIGFFPATSGGEVSSAEGIKLSFPANSIITSTGQLYAGNVNVAARWIDPTAIDLPQIMPGNLQGINRFNEEMALASYGMMAVELTGDSGEELNIGNNLKAELSFPVPSQLQDNAPDEIPLWYFNEDYGLWQEEGTAVLVGDNYVGEVSHFSFWNCDAPFPLVYISGTVVNENGVPIVNALVCASFPASNGGTYTACGYTDNDGYFGGKMPSGEELTLTISQFGSCYEILASSIGPFDVDTDLGIIEATSPDLIEITGTIVDCNDEPLTNGWVEFKLGNQVSYFYLEDDNVISTSLFNCNNATELEVTGINLDDFEESDVLTYAVAPTIDLGEIDACGNVLDEFFIMTVNGESETFIMVSAVDSVGSLLIFANQPGNDNNLTVSFTVDPNDVFPQTYDGTIVEWMSSFIDFPTQEFLYNNCSGIQCGFVEIIITEYGDVGQKIKGSFNGEGDFWDIQQQQVTLPFEGEFEVIRDF